MTQPQKNEAIAMRLGWEREQRGDSYVWIVPYPDGSAVSVRADLPNWCTDLNAVQRDLVPVIEERDLWSLFFRNLYGVAGTKDGSLSDLSWGLRRGLMATAEQLVDAWLACMEGK